METEAVSMEDYNDKTPLNTEKDSEIPDYDAILAANSQNLSKFAERTAVGEVAS